MDSDQRTEAPMEWTEEIETLLASWCDHAKCYIWMHGRALDIAERRVFYYIWTYHILSTIAGLSNIMAGDLMLGAFKVAWFFGGLTILLTSLSLLQEKLGLNERVLNHRKLGLQALTIKMKLEEILSLPREVRGDCRTFMRYIKNDINATMVEKNATIPRGIREACLLEFRGKEGFDIPDVCGQVEHTKVFGFKKPLQQPLLSIDIPRDTQDSS